MAIVPAGIGPDAEPHDHDFYELVYVRRGGGVHVINDRPFPMLRGDLYCLHPQDLHAYRDSSEDASIINVIFQAPLFTDSQWDDLKALPGLAPFLDRGHEDVTHKLALTPADADEIEGLCDRLLSEFRKQPPGWRITLRAGLTDLLVRIGRTALAYGGANDEAQLHPGPVADTIARLHRDWDQPLTVAELARDAGLTANWFGEVFKQQTGLTVNAYQTKLRIDHARKQLEQQTSRITDIALDCGYDDPSYFARVFRRVTGVTPRDYRQMLE